MSTKKEELVAIAREGGYEGDMPSTIAEAINAVGSVAGGGSGGGMVVNLTGGYSSVDKGTGYFTIDKTAAEIIEYLGSGNDDVVVQWTPTEGYYGTKLFHLSEWRAISENNATMTFIAGNLGYIQDPSVLPYLKKRTLLVLSIEIREYFGDQISVEAFEFVPKISVSFSGSSLTDQRVTFSTKNHSTQVTTTLESVFNNGIMLSAKMTIGTTPIMMQLVRCEIKSRVANVLFVGEDISSDGTTVTKYYAYANINPSAGNNVLCTVKTNTITLS